MKRAKAPQSDRAAAILPPDAEIIANLWYVIDDKGFIYSLRIQLYVGEGTDEEKLAFLKTRAYRDYLVARPFPVPNRFRTKIIEVPDGQETEYAVIHHDDAVRLGGIDQLFFEGLDILQKDLPAQTQLRIPESPMIKVTALIGDDNGQIVPHDAIRS